MNVAPKEAIIVEAKNNIILNSVVRYAAIIEINFTVIIINRHV